MQIMTAHNLVFDILLPIRSEARTSDDLSLLSAYRNIILIALHQYLPHHNMSIRHCVRDLIGN